MAKRKASAFNPRQYMLSKDYEVYYYSDLHFQSVGSHAHDYYEFYFFVEGAVVMELGGRQYPLQQGDVIVVPPGVRHRALITDPTKPYRRFVLWLGREYWAALVQQSEDYRCLLEKTDKGSYRFHFDLLAFNTLRSSLFLLLDELHTDRFGRQTQIGLHICQLLLNLNRLVYEQSQSAGVRESSSKYETITAFIETHLEEDLSLDRIAGEFYLSKYYVAHLFQDSVGLSVHQYITKKRLRACADAIQSGAKISEAYLRYGFGDYSSFYRAFLKEYGVSPSVYRDVEQQLPNLR